MIVRAAENNVHKPDDPRLVHGMLAYDYFQVMRVLQEMDGTLRKNEEWAKINFRMRR